MNERKTSIGDMDSPCLCSICSQYGVKMKAVEQCKECNIKYCGACISDHRRLGRAGHQIESLDSTEEKSFPDLKKSLSVDFKDEKAVEAFVSLLMENASMRDDPLTAYYVTDISVGLSDDVMDCYVTGCLAMPNKQLLIVDKNNMRLKLFDSNGSNISTAMTPNVTWGITKLGPTSVATCGSGKRVTFWEVKEDKISKMRSVQVSEMAFGISNNSRLLCIMHPHLDSLTFISKQKEVIVNYKRFYAPFGKQLSFGFDLELDEMCAYVGCGLGDKRIIAVNLTSMTIIWECPLLGNTCGVLELRGQLIVADMTNKKIVTVSKKGDILQTLISLEFMEGRPQYMACNTTGRTLFVSQFGNDIVTVFGIRAD